MRLLALVASDDPRQEGGLSASDAVLAAIPHLRRELAATVAPAVWRTLKRSSCAWPSADVATAAQLRAAVKQDKP